MRVLHISNDYHNSGVYKTLHDGFLRDGLESVFFVPMPAQAPESMLSNVIEPHCFGKWDRFFYMNKQRKIYKHFRAAVEQCRPDLNHGYFLFSGGIHCLWAKKEFGIPYVITVQNTDVNTIYRYFIHLRALAWEIIREAEQVIFVSEAYRSFTLEHMVPRKERQAQKSKFKLLPFAVDPFWTEHTDPRRRTAPEGKLRLLTAGVVTPLKNQLCTAEAVRILRQKGIDAELVVVGAGVDQQIDQKLRQMEFVRRIEKIPKEELIEEYRKADIFVLPSLTESFGLVYAEALSQGVPVIYSAGQGFDNQFPEGVVGYHVDARDPDAVAEGICRVLDRYEQIQMHCAEASRRFSRDTVCALGEEYYQQVLRTNDSI